jgi:hypothetical protein
LQEKSGLARTAVVMLITHDRRDEMLRSLARLGAGGRRRRTAV